MYQKEEVVKTNELERDISGLIQKDTRKKKYKERSLVIEHYSQLLSKNKIRIGRFLQMMANMDNKIIIQEHEYPILNSEDIEFESTEDLNDFNTLMNPSADTINDTSAVMFANPSGISNASETVATKRRYAKKKSNTSTVLTRAKVRKLALQESSAGKKRTASDVDISDIDSSDATDPMTTNAPKRAKERSESIDPRAGITLSAATLEIERLNKHFEKIYNREVEVHLNTECVMDCKRPRGTVLLPCQHQPTCNQCFVLWRVFVDQKGDNRTTFCPFCRTQITSTIVVHN